MSAGNTPSKRGTTTDADNIVPLLFAANPGIIPNYKKMSAMDSEGRTTSALEHKFRKWRQTAKEILAAHPEEAASTEAVGKPTEPKKKRAPAKGVKGGMQATADEDEDDEEETPSKANSKKRAASAEGKDEDGNPTKKPKVQKKGIAQKVKKPAKRGTEDYVSASEGSDNEKTAAEAMAVLKEKEKGKGAGAKKVVKTDVEKNSNVGEQGEFIEMQFN